MIDFACPVCSRAFKVTDDKAWLRTKCPQCKEPLVVPAPPSYEEHTVAEVQPRRDGPSEETEQPLTPHRVVWGGIALVLACVLIPIGLWVWSSKSAPENLPSASTNAGTQEQDAAVARAEKLAAEQRAETERLRAEVARQQADLSSLREEQTRKEAVKSTDAVLAKMRVAVAEMKKLNEEMRAVLSKYDEEMMHVFARDGIEPYETDKAQVQDFYAERGRLRALANKKLARMADEVSKLAQNVQGLSLPPDVKSDFDRASQLEINHASAILRQPPPDPLAKHKDAVLAAQLVKDIIRKERIQNSKRAIEALEKFGQRLPAVGAKDELCQVEFARIAAALNLIQRQYAEKKLTYNSANDLLKQIPWNDSRYNGALETFVRVAGDYRTDHNPDSPSVKETYDELQRLGNVRR